jgi:hypothetical protein
MGKGGQWLQAGCAQKGGRGTENVKTREAKARQSKGHHSGTCRLLLQRWRKDTKGVGEKAILRQHGSLHPLLLSALRDALGISDGQPFADSDAARK